MSPLLKNALKEKYKTYLTVGMIFFSFEVLSGVSSIPAPPVSVDSFILVDHQTGEVLAEKNADKSVEPASLVRGLFHRAALEFLQLHVTYNLGIRLNKKKRKEMTTRRTSPSISKRLSSDRWAWGWGGLSSTPMLNIS